MDNRNNYSGNPYLQVAAAAPNGYGPYGRRPVSRICDVLNRCGKRVDDVTRKAEVFADNVWHHLKVSPSFTDAAVARIAQGTKVLAEGGHDKVFHQTFGILAGEKLLKAYVCYFSTSSGPVVGTLYLSTKRLAFCSDHPFCYYSSTGQQQFMYYKVVVQLEKLRTVNPSSSRMNPYDKYIQVVTTDGHELWFMGFISYDKALKQLREALQRPRDSYGDIAVTVV
ncbi:GEM-like protein 1 [Euphorbia lathyris]|uniref:GEM-like protein 1 n=1 Tax=Euphorbia lathyris TaxID=212925 RepID=UPI0033139292